MTYKSSSRFINAISSDNACLWVENGKNTTMAGIINDRPIPTCTEEWLENVHTIFCTEGGHSKSINTRWIPGFCYLMLFD